MELYNKLKVLNRILDHILSKLWYRLFLKKGGRKFLIIKPILFTPHSVSIGDFVFIRNNARIEGVSSYENINYQPNIILHDNVAIEQNVHITCANRIEIGANTAIAANVTITDINHPYVNISLPPERQELEVHSVFIGADCKIYNNAVILPNAKIGKHSVIAANSVVLGKRYPDYCIIAGSPAKIIKRYDFESQTWRKTNSEGEFV